MFFFTFSLIKLSENLYFILTFYLPYSVNNGRDNSYNKCTFKHFTLAVGINNYLNIIERLYRLYTQTKRY